MTTQEVIDILDQMVEGGDTEAQHGEADELLCAYLEQQGKNGADVAAAFRRAQKRCGF